MIFDSAAASRSARPEWADCRRRSAHDLHTGEYTCSSLLPAEGDLRMPSGPCVDPGATSAQHGAAGGAGPA